MVSRPTVRVSISTAVCGLARVCLVTFLSPVREYLGRISAWLWLAWWCYVTARRRRSVRWGRSGGLQLLVRHLRRVELDAL